PPSPAGPERSGGPRRAQPGGGEAGERGDTIDRPADGGWEGLDAGSGARRRRGWKLPRYGLRSPAYRAEVTLSSSQCAALWGVVQEALRHFRLAIAPQGHTSRHGGASRVAGGPDGICHTQTPAAPGARCHSGKGSAKLAAYLENAAHQA